MSDNDYLCRLYGLEPSQSHELVEIILQEEDTMIRDSEDKLFLNAGRLVHLVWLTSDTPAAVIKVEFNKVLEESLEFQGFNQLKSMGSKNPAHWFLERNMDYKVRSRKSHGIWLQCVFGGPHLIRNEIIEYLRNCTNLEFDESKIEREGCQTFGDM